MQRRKLPDDLAVCWHCGNETRQEDLGAESYYADGSQENVQTEALKCTTCGGVALTLKVGNGAPQLVHPASRDLPAVTPVKVQERYLEAARIRPISPTAYALLMRATLDEICTDCQIAPATLPERFTALIEKLNLPAVFHELAIHIPAPDSTATPESVDLLDRFFRAILEYVYVAPALVKEVYQPLPVEGRGSPTSP